MWSVKETLKDKIWVILYNNTMSEHILKLGEHFWNIEGTMSNDQLCTLFQLVMQYLS